MERALSPSDVIITAASLKPLSFLPGDSPQLLYSETGPANIYLSVSRVTEDGRTALWKCLENKRFRVNPQITRLIC